MALAIDSASLCLFEPTGNSNSDLFFSRNRSRIILTQKKCRVGVSQHKLEISCCSLESFPQRRICRRDLALVVLGLSSVSVTLPFSATLADEELKMASFMDEINAYSYLYPVELPSKKFFFKWAESRKPERYSSAAPLSRPSNSKFIKSSDKSTWTAKDVADSVLSDKSALDQESNIYRHYLSSRAERDGYLYSECFNSQPKVEKMNSFRLVSPTEDYVPAYKDPWRFW